MLRTRTAPEQNAAKTAAVSILLTMLGVSADCPSIVIAVLRVAIMFVIVTGVTTMLRLLGASLSASSHAEVDVLITTGYLL